MRSVLVTNDFPPKVGGIQSYLWELWRRLPSGITGVITTSYEGDSAFDAAAPFPIVRLPEKMLLPRRRIVGHIRDQLRAWAPDLVFLDPALPIGHAGPRLGFPYVVIAHGAEITVFRRLPGSGLAMRRVLRRSEGVVAAGGFPAREALRAARRDLKGLVVPPGVDATRFRPRMPEERKETRERFGLDPSRPLVLGVSRLVPRKGFDVVIDAVAGLPDVQLAIAGDGRDRGRLEKLARRRGLSGRVRFLGRVPDTQLPELYACSDVFAMLCRERWAGLEQEGFGIVFLEAAASGVAAVAGHSGGAHEAVVDEQTGYVVPPRDVGAVRARLTTLLDDADLRSAMGEAARERAVDEFSYDSLATQLSPLASGNLAVLEPLSPMTA